MKTFFKKTFAIMLTAVMLLSMMPFTASAAEATPDTVGVKSGTTGNCTWEIDSEGTLTISGFGSNGNMADYDATDHPCPWKNESFHSVIIDFEVNHVGDYAFYECSGITNVTFVGGLTIGNSAFEGCRNLNSVTFYHRITSIGEKAFGYYQSDGYHKVDGFTIKGYRDSAAETYANDNGFTFIAWPDYRYRVLDDGTAELTRYDGISSDVTIPSVIDGYTVTGINDTFEDRSDITSVTIPDTVTYLDEFAFSCCTGLTSVTVPDSVMRIGKYVFYQCANLNSISIGESVTSIDEYAFEGCSALTIIGYTGSAAEAYANEHGFTFIALPNNAIKGDVNEDGAVTIADATMLQQFLAEFIELDLTDEKTFRQVDKNEDGYVNIRDVTEIQRQVAELI